jgi:hypothetical protein
VLPAAQAVAVISTFSVPHTLPPPEMVGATAAGIFVIFNTLEATLDPHDVEQVAVIACVVDTWILKPVAPVDHVIVPPAQPAAVMVATWPSQHSVLSAVSVGTLGAALVPITTGAEAADVPQSDVHVAVYDPGPTTLLVPVPNVPDHVMVPPAQPAAVTVVVALAHTSVAPDNTGATGAALVPITIELDTVEIPQISEQVAVYVPGPTALLVPVPNEPDHVMVPPVQPVAVIVAVVFGQTSVAPANTGAAGTGLAPTVIGVEFALLPHVLSQYALYVPAPTLIV